MAYLALKDKNSFWRQYAFVKELDSDLAKRLYDAFFNDRQLLVNK